MVHYLVRDGPRLVRTAWYVLWVDLAGVKDGQIEARAVNGAGASAWLAEPRLWCECWAGPAGCPVAVLATAPASGVCP